MEVQLKIFLFAVILRCGSALPMEKSEKVAKLHYMGDDFDEEHSFVKIKKHSNNDTKTELDMLMPTGSHRVGGFLKCSVCKMTLKYALWKYRTPQGTYDGLPEFVQSACKHLRIESDNICDGIVTTYKAVVLTLLQKLQLSAEQVCGLILPSTCYAPDLPWNKIKWNITLPGEIPKPKPTHKPNAPLTPLKILQLSDIHIDLQYQIGSTVDCSDPLCCRNNKKMKAGARLAGYWGSLGYCDTPYWTLENLLQHVSKNNYDYIIWTGDLPAHNDWAQSRETQTQLLFNLTQLFTKYFPKVKVYPSLGNHESFPVNNFPPGYVKDKNNSISWLYEALQKAWQSWLPADALETVGQSGCYTTLVKPGFRIISLNMNYCNQQNWWMLLNPVDPNNELEWFVKVLSSAEQNGERVHILGHIPPGSFDCLPVWSYNYYKIINRFKEIIAAQFFGHTHSDSIEIFYDEVTKKIPTSVAYVAPSVTTYFNLHPGYREYSIEPTQSGSEWNVLDHDTYFLNLTKANHGPDLAPTWELLYSAKESYNLTDLSPKSWNDLVNSWISGVKDSTFQDYYYRFSKGNPPTPLCDRACKKNMLCDIRSARSGASQEFC